MRIISLNHRDWKYGYFYFLDPCMGRYFGIHNDARRLRKTHGVPVLESLPGEIEEVAYLEYLNGGTLERLSDKKHSGDCSRNSSPLRVSKDEVERFYLWGSVFPPLLGLIGNGGYVFSADCSRRLETAGFSGFEPHEIPTEAFRESQFQLPEGVKLFRQGTHGPWCGLRYTFEDEMPAHCACCGTSIICSECGQVSLDCSQCERKNVWIFGREPDVTDITIKISQVDGISGIRWNGNDFMGNVVSARVVRFLESIHAYPYLAMSIPVDTAGMTPAQLQRLEEVKELNCCTPMPLNSLSG